MDATKIDVILLNWNGEKLINKCLDSLKKQIYKHFKLVIVDNNSTDNSIKNLDLSGLNYSMIKLDENLGFARGMNQGIANSKSDYLILLNYDVYLKEDYLQNLVTIFDKNPKIGVLGGQAFDWDGILFSNIHQESSGYFAPYVKGKFYKLPDESLYRVERVHGSFPAFRRASLDLVFSVKNEFYDEDFITTWEDSDLWMVCKLLNIPIAHSNKLVAWHYGSASWGGAKKFIEKPFDTQVMVLRNRIAIILQNFPSLVLLITLPVILIFEILQIIYYSLFSRDLLKAEVVALTQIKCDFKKIINKRKKLQKNKKIKAIHFLSVFSSRYKKI